VRPTPTAERSSKQDLLSNASDINQLISIEGSSSAGLNQAKTKTDKH
jgi:hypothetical protein